MGHFGGWVGVLWLRFAVVEVWMERANATVDVIARRGAWTLKVEALFFLR